MQSSTVFEMEDITNCELLIEHAVMNGNFSKNKKILAYKLIQQSKMINKLTTALVGLRRYESILKETNRYLVQAKALGDDLDEDPELKIEINHSIRNKAGSMFQMQDDLNTVREVFMESSLFKLRFGGNLQFLEEKDLDIDMIKNNKFVAGTLQIIENKAHDNLGKNSYLHCTDDANGKTGDLRGHYIASRSDQ